MTSSGPRTSGVSNVGGPFWPSPISSAIEITERGLAFAGGTLLVRMRKSAEGRDDLAVGADRERMLAMLSVAFARPIDASDVVPHVEIAAAHWCRGEKALANLRLVFAGLAAPVDPAADARVALAAYLLDQGWPPAALLEELGLADGPADVEKYNPNHVPAGHGRRSGQFDVRSGAARPSDGAILVAAGDEADDFRERDLFGETTPKEELRHGHPITPSTGIPIVGGQGGATGGLRTVDTLSAAARAAVTKVGPGKGPVYGTVAHTEFKAQVKALGRDDLHNEQSYLNRQRVEYGTPGSVRVDTVEGAKDRPDKGYDLKTGSARLPLSRVKQFQSHLPLREDGTEVTIHEVRP